MVQFLESFLIRRIIGQITTSTDCLYGSRKFNSCISKIFLCFFFCFPWRLRVLFWKAYSSWHFIDTICKSLTALIEVFVWCLHAIKSSVNLMSYIVSFFCYFDCWTRDENQWLLLRYFVNWAVKQIWTYRFTRKFSPKTKAEHKI